MKNISKALLQGGLLLACMIMISAAMLGVNQVNAADEGSERVAQATPEIIPGGDNDPNAQPEVRIPGNLQAQGFAPQADGGSTVYFAPQDETTNTTVIFLYNTTGDAVNVDITTYDLDGIEYLSTSIPVPARSMVRICADEVVTDTTSWNGFVLVNFRSYSAYGKMILPDGVEVEGYIVWNGTSTYDPLLSFETLPLRLSTDLYAIFFPIIKKSSEMLPLILASVV